MFSGIIENKGIVKEFKKIADYRLVVDTDLKYTDIKKGSSISCNGVYLTVTSKKRMAKKTKLIFDVSEETVKCTNFKLIKIGDLINIEKSLRVGDEISGHFVFGHVDATAPLVSLKKIGGSYKLKFQVIKNLRKFITKKGSVSINGISLTINSIKKGEISLNIIPYTWNKTNLHKIKVGDRINLEVDMLARYVTKNR